MHAKMAIASEPHGRTGVQPSHYEHCVDCSGRKVNYKVGHVSSCVCCRLSKQCARSLFAVSSTVWSVAVHLEILKNRSKWF